MVKISPLLFITLAPCFVFAQSVFINEIAWMGTPVAGVEEKQWWRYEWLELFNNTDIVVVLDGWTLELYRDKLDFTVSLNSTIVPNGYYVVGASEKILNLDLNYKNLGGKFFNGGQKVVLKNSLGEIIDEVDATLGRSGSEEPSGSKSWPAGDNKTKQTMERTQEGCLHCEALSGVEGAKQWHTSKDSGGTPKAANSEGTASQTKRDLVSLKTKSRLVQDETEKDLSGHSTLRVSDSKRSFQSRISFVHPITLLAGFLALGFSGVLLLVKRSLALRQNRRV